MTSPRSELPALAPEQPGLVWFSGPDAVRFLNDLISQEIGDLGDGETRRSFLLGPQGKLHFLLWVIREGDRIGLVTEPDRSDELAAALSRYRIRVDLDLEVEERDRFIVVGPYDGFDVSWPGVERHLVIGERPGLDTQAGERYQAVRVAAGEPRWGVDVEEKTIPHESGLVPVSVDFEKGCFLGQELVARIDSRGGNVPRRLRLLEASLGDIEEGSPVTFSGDEVGLVTSAAGRFGLAMVRREVEEGVVVDVGGVAAMVRPLPPKSGK